MPSTPRLPDHAPFSSEQRAWLNGMIAAIYPAHSSSDHSATEAPQPFQAGIPLKILFGSQTGNAEGLAKKTAKAAQKKNFIPSVTDLGSYEPEALAKESRLLILTSTYGDGEPPDNTKAFYDFLHSDSAPRLDHLSYSVLGLGDSSYPDFNQCAIHIDERLSALGASRISPAMFCDVDFDADAEAWQTACFDSLTNE